MKLLRYGEPGRELPGLMDGDGGIRDLSGQIDDLAGSALGNASLARLRALDPRSLPRVEGSPRLGPCAGGIGKFICIGLNYSDHAAEIGVPLPEEPVIFLKATSAVSGPEDPIVIPPGSIKTDWEVELAFIIGREARNVAEADWADYVAGYCVVNDISERHWQLEGTGQWVKGKSADSFGPLGPWLVTCDEIPDPHSLDIWLEVDGHRYQNGNTATMVFKVPYLLSYVSRYMSLQPGDIISTGTPPGVGLGLEPSAYLRAGQQVNLSVAGLGEQRHPVVDASG